MSSQKKKKIQKKISSDEDFEIDCVNNTKQEKISTSKKLDFFSDNSGNEFIERMNVKLSKKLQQKKTKVSDDEMADDVTESDSEDIHGSERRKSSPLLESNSERRAQKKKKLHVLESDDEEETLNSKRDEELSSASEGSNDETQERNNQLCISDKFSQKTGTLKEKEESCDQDRGKHHELSVNDKVKSTKSSVKSKTKSFSNSSDSESSDQLERTLNESKVRKNGLDSDSDDDDDDDMPLNSVRRNKQMSSGSIISHLKEAEGSSFRKERNVDSSGSDDEQPLKKCMSTKKELEVSENEETGKLKTLKVSQMDTSSSDEEPLANVKRKRSMIRSKKDSSSEEEYKPLKKNRKQAYEDRGSDKKTSNCKNKSSAKQTIKKTKTSLKQMPKVDVSDSEDDLPLSKSKKESSQSSKGHLPSSGKKSGTAAKQLTVSMSDDEEPRKASGASSTDEDEESETKKELREQPAVSGISATENEEDYGSKDDNVDSKKSSDSEDDKPLKPKCEVNMSKVPPSSSDAEEEAVKNGNRNSESSASESDDTDQVSKEERSKRKGKNYFRKNSEEKSTHDSIATNNSTDSEKDEESGKHTPARRSSNADKESSSEEHMSPDQKNKASSRKNKADDHDSRIERLKRYIRTAGLRVQYTKVLEGCKSRKAKVNRLLEVLADAGLKGKPTLESCKKLKKKRERQQEIAELDVSNIITSEGRSRRQARSSLRPSTPSTVNESPKPVKKVFSRLKGIVNSDDSE